MAWASVDDDNRVIEWSYEHLYGMDIEFANGEYIDANCVNGVEDFKIVDGQREVFGISKLMKKTKLDMKNVQDIRLAKIICFSGQMGRIILSKSGIGLMTMN